MNSFAACRSAIAGAIAEIARNQARIGSGASRVERPFVLFVLIF
jgi:hypothetical protein